MQRIVIDTDGGVDDALKLLLALAWPDTRIEAITTVHGDVFAIGCFRLTMLALRSTSVYSARYIVTGGSDNGKQELRQLIDQLSAAEQGGSAESDELNTISEAESAPIL